MKPTTAFNQQKILLIAADTYTISFSVILSLLCLFLFLCTVICNFRSSICQALVLEIGETVQILEKSEGKRI